MSDFSNYEMARIVPGKTARIVLNMLPGSPAAHVEHLGESNVAYYNEMLADSAAAGAAVGSRKRSAKERKEVIDKRRVTLARHAVRKLEAKFSDGTPAPSTPDVIEKWLNALPEDVVTKLYLFALDEDNFREHSFTNVADVAEKS